MSKQQPSTFQTLSRLTIMLGTLGIGSTAAWHYRPEPQDLADLIDSTASMVMEVPGQDASSTVAEDFSEITPEAFGAPPAFDAPVADDARHFDPAVRPASAVAPIAESADSRPMTPVLDRLERDRLTAPLLAAGAIRADVQPWGRGDQQVFRATAAFPIGDPTAGLESRVDAVEATPEGAVSALLARLNQTRIAR